MSYPKRQFLSNNSRLIDRASLLRASENRNFSQFVLITNSEQAKLLKNRSKIHVLAKTKDNFSLNVIADVNNFSRRQIAYAFRPTLNHVIYFKFYFLQFCFEIRLQSLQTLSVANVNSSIISKVC